MTIHDDEHPFADPEDERDPIRRFRGRLAAPVTVITSGGPDDRAGLTVSSIIVAEGQPPTVHFLCGPENDVWDRIVETGTFVVHVLEERHSAISDAFAFIRPSPGGPFKGLEVVDSPHGPVITSIQTRAACRHVFHRELTAHALVEGAIESVSLHDMQRPLGWFRGSYLRRGQGEGHS